ncbi:hypothetical protein ABIA32_005412 [Streptacidiphilus sp. MAP12-20]|uniref:hypothetical protein n=1 Tax=Streptacidiphilus sp. MAP12-20 TaxID=3156299 RepID=UPI003515AF0E
MTAATAAPAAGRPRSAVARGQVMLRLLRLELRHNAMVWLLPVAIGLFWLTTYRKDMAMPPLWNLRAAGLQSGAVLAFAVPVTGAAAWMGSREARRRVTDQVTITARPGWARLLAPWAATTIWAMAAYLGCVAVLYGVTAHQASWGGPLWWPAAVAAASLPAFSALGFAVGTFVPSRFTAPLAAIASFFVLALSTELINGSQSAWQISPLVTGPWNLGPQAGVATFYPFVPDLPIAQVMFLTGTTLALLAALALPAASAGRSTRAIAACLTAAGLLAAGTAAVLAGTGTMNAQGAIDIPALHDAASDQPLRFTPVCSHTAIPVCLNPAYAGYLPGTANALAPLLSQLAGLPGAPTRILQESVTYRPGNGNGLGVRQGGSRVGGTSSDSHLVLPVQLPGPSLTAEQLAAQLRGQLAQAYGPDLVARVVGDGPGASQAQNAVARALLLAAGLHEVPVDQGPSARAGGLDPSPWPSVAPGTPAYAAAERFAALLASARHAWLVQHLAALRAGQITPEQLP